MIATVPADESRGATDGESPPAALFTKPIVELMSVDLGYASASVLTEVEISIGEGQFWCFLGPNGEGKTTLIKAILGALSPRRGRIFRNPEVFARGRVSYVPQRLELNPVLPTSVREFILTGLAGVRTHGNQRQSRLDRVLEIVGLGASRHQNYWTLSGGQKQRALLARALIRDPQVLIVDEPTAGLDLAAAAAVLRVLADMHATYNVTIVFVTHDLAIVTRHATHAALFKGGAVRSGELADVITEEALGHTFGVPVPVRCDEDGRPQIQAACS
ncbi:metal ABC transporter ATP-binding protein [Mucisphaera calidilacus]|uniref:Zinc import ATP-binding protein ZnuC n=1 Tax=Mucisphaera calidilacus TaxID=2527982 RepID=A0A518BXX5_9BACT|nr:ATP-binding cassette domain-containing protein [Mucisphaera calidilacus]QDU71822.1 Zinc import ATP-binding protein ZnuC [Mucisphaera calidilacus]